MTSKEALETVKDYLLLKLKEDNSELGSMIIVECVNSLEKLVERDTPMKVEYNDMDDRCCPICEEVQLPNVYATNNEFCPYCGQKLDWSVEND